MKMLCICIRRYSKPNMSANFENINCLRVSGNRFASFATGHRDQIRALGSLFTSKYSASSILNKLESAAKKLNLNILKSKEIDYKVKLQGMSEGRKGKLSMTVEVFEVAPEGMVLDFSKSSGNTLEYKKFCEDDVRPALKDIVWKWQGEDNICY